MHCVSGNKVVAITTQQKKKIRLCYYRKYVQMLVMNFKNVELSTFEERFEIFHPPFVKKRQVS